MPRITESTGDIFAAPQNSVLILPDPSFELDACNCRGVWGSGVALEFKKRYPQAFEVYHEECNTPSSEFHQKSLLGTALLIPPQDEDLATTADEGHWIACFFTSVDYGKKVSSELVILESTKKAMADLQKKMKFWKAKGQEFGDLWAVRINSGKFGVPWDRTKRILEQCGMDMKVVAPADENVEVVEEGKQNVKVDSNTKKTAAMAGKASQLDAADGGAVVEKSSKGTVKTSKKRKERQASLDLDESQSQEKIPDDRVKSSKKRKDRKQSSDKSDSWSGEKSKRKAAKKANRTKGDT
ncbi:ADP-ribose 1''-phosphate phosphatase [Xylographa bjoerkii]|nr:ADP-ribose 1''-phosphate phosphatase [Xylographa bjoerkii]